ncbi:galactose mutarotase-like enzyme [Sphingomonas jejuensis]|uniref:Galactose mutarotase-like enzyme n=1 Tax=Sphingomonas jejuensis TaxID=904715 RepID=A0ABX0XQF1_9SPHN|nr:galactose mutarotase-like enzyme [Sphingomonas jejuensis]
MADRVRIASDALSAEIDPFGAELQRLTTAAGEELLWDGDPAFWTGRAPLLFPIVGALKNGAYRLDGESYTLPKHGFARTSAFALIEQQADSATFRLADSAETRAHYPFTFTLDMAFALSGAELSMRATISNRGLAPMPFSFGFHPAFRWPLPGTGAKTDHRILFAAEEPSAIRGVSPDGLLTGSLPSPVNGREIALRDALFAHDALVWDDLTSRSLRFEGAGGVALDITFPDTPMLGLWMKPGAGYLCIEPWQGHADPEDATSDLRAKPGIVEVAPGDFRRFRMTVALG